MENINLNSNSKNNPNQPEDVTKNEEVASSSVLSPSAAANSSVNSVVNSSPKSSPAQCEEGKDALNTSAPNIQPGQKKKPSGARKRQMKKATRFQRKSMGGGESPWLGVPTSPWEFRENSVLEYFSARDSDGNYLWENAFMSVMNRNPFAGDQGCLTDGLRSQDNMETQVFGGPGPSWQQELPSLLASDPVPLPQMGDGSFRYTSHESSERKLIRNPFSSQGDSEFTRQSLSLGDSDSIEYPFKFMLNQSSLSDRQANLNHWPKEEFKIEDTGSRELPLGWSGPLINSREQFSLDARGDFGRKRSRTSPGRDGPPKQRRNPLHHYQSPKPTTSNRPQEGRHPPKQPTADGPSRLPPPSEISSSKKMAVVNVEYPMQKLSKRHIDDLQLAFLEAIRQNPGKGPKFKGCTSEEGGLVLDCADDKAVSWLQKTISGMNPWRGITLKMIGAKKLGCVAYEKIRMRIPRNFDHMTNAQILDMVAKQNNGFQASEWVVLGRKSERDDLDLVVKIPPSEVETLRKMSFMVYFGFDRVHVSILKNSQ